MYCTLTVAQLNALAGPNPGRLAGFPVAPQASPLAGPNPGRQFSPLAAARDGKQNNNFNLNNNRDGNQDGSQSVIQDGSRDGGGNRAENQPSAQEGGPDQVESRQPARGSEAFRPLFLTLALFSWLFAMLTSFAFDSVRTSQPLSGLSGLIHTLSIYIVTGAWPWPQVLCGAAMFLAALLRCRHSTRPLAARLVICALAWLPLVFFVLARPFMGPVSSTMIFGLSCLLVALPMDAAFREQKASGSPVQGE